MNRRQGDDVSLHLKTDGEAPTARFEGAEDSEGSEHSEDSEKLRAL
ncbi:MAG: hypothetical protein II200_02430 [Bacteroidaceae bacterium]|nr:hypothetical protein [Bacteroidaceae bacterium]